MNKQKQPISLNKIMIAITALSFIATIFIYSSLPAVITYHWGIDGSVKTVEKWVTPITAGYGMTTREQAIALSVRTYDKAPEI